jgi:hypothetical protein
VVQQTSRLGSTVVNEIMSVNPRTGKVTAVRKLGSAYEQALLTDGRLWVTTGSGRAVWLWRLDPASLSLISRARLPGSVTGGSSFGIFGSMTSAGGWVWVGAFDKLDRVSPISGHVAGTVPIGNAQGIEVTSNAKGSVLIDSEGHESARIQSRDPHTGALLAQSPVFVGVTKPYLGGVFDGGLWISEAGGMMGFVQRLSITTLKPTAFAGAKPNPGLQAPPEILGTNGVQARVIDNILWVTQSYGGPTRNYCGTPLTGSTVAPIKLGNVYRLLAVDGSDIYYVPNASRQTDQQLDRMKINPRC